MSNPLQWEEILKLPIWTRIYFICKNIAVAEALDIELYTSLQDRRIFCVTQQFLQFNENQSYSGLLIKPDDDSKSSSTYFTKPLTEYYDCYLVKSETFTDLCARIKNKHKKFD